MPKQLNNGAITAALQRAFGFKGRYQPMLDEVIVPVYQISDPAPAGPIANCIGTVVHPGAADTTTLGPFVSILNPPGSGKTVIIQSVAMAAFKDLVGPQNADVVQVDARFHRNSPGPDRGNSFFRDQRLAGEPYPSLGIVNRPVCVVSFGLRGYFDPDAVFASTLLKRDGTVAELSTAIAPGERAPLAVLQENRGVEMQFALDEAGTGDGSSADTPLLMNLIWLELPNTFLNPTGSIP